MAQIAPAMELSRPPVFVASRTAPATGADGIAGGMTIVSIPAVNRVHAMSLNEAIADAVKAAVDRPDMASGAAGSLDEESDGGAVPDLGAAVIEAHEARISVLRTRIEALRAQGVAPSLIVDLATRLRRAEAARRLAMVRAGGASPGLGIADCLIGGDGRRCPTTPVASLTVESAGRPPFARRSGPGSHLRDGRATVVAVRWRPHTATRRALRLSPLDHGARAGGGLAVVNDRTATRVVMVAALDYRPLRRVPMTVAASFGRPSVRRADAGRSVNARLGFARRSLAAARRALEAGFDAQPARRTATIAGLWRWEGSDSWTLAPGRPAKLASSIGDHAGGRGAKGLSRT